MDKVNLQAGDIFDFKDRKWLALEVMDDSVLAIMTELWDIRMFTRAECDCMNDWRTSTLRQELIDELLPELGAENLKTHVTDLVADNGDDTYGTCEDLVFLLSCDEFRKYRKILMKSKLMDEFWWTVTPWNCGRGPTPGNGCYVRYVTPAGSVSYYSATYAYGVVPACIIKRAAF